MLSANQMSQTRNTADKVWWPPAPVVVPDHCIDRKTNEAKNDTRRLNHSLSQRLHGWCLSSPISNWTRLCLNLRLLSHLESKSKIAIASVQHVWFHPDMVLRPSQNVCMVKPRASRTGCTSFTCCVITRCYLLIKCLKPAILRTRFGGLLRRWRRLIIA